MSIASSSASSITSTSTSTNLALGQGVGDVRAESGGDIWVVRIIKCNVIYYKCLTI